MPAERIDVGSKLRGGFGKLADANARAGSVLTQAVGPVAAEKENASLAAESVERISGSSTPVPGQDVEGANGTNSTNGTRTRNFTLADKLMGIDKKSKPGLQDFKYGKLKGIKQRVIASFKWDVCNVTFSNEFKSL